MQVLSKPVQSWKTWESLQIISRIIKINEEDIIIFFTDNSNLQTTQLADRIKKYFGEEVKSIIISSQHKTNIVNLQLFLFKTHGPKIVIHCSNKTQIENISETLIDLGSDKYKKYFRIFIDEADKSLSTFAPYYDKWNKYANVKEITLITATPTRITEKYKNIQILDVESHNPESYHGFKDCIYKITRLSITEISHLQYKIEIIKHLKINNLFNKGDLYFVPGSKEVKTHEEIKNVLFDNSFDAVIIINGKGVQFFSKKDSFSSIDDKITISEIIDKLYDKYDLFNKLVGITGHICINRGITINSPKVQITHVIAQLTSTNSDEEYQEYGRICGNIKNFPNYRKTKIFCGIDFKNTMIDKENELMTRITKNTKIDECVDEDVINKNVVIKDVVNKNVVNKIVKNDIDKKKNVEYTHTIKTTKSKTIIKVK